MSENGWTAIPSGYIFLSHTPDLNIPDKEFNLLPDKVKQYVVALESEIGYLQEDKRRVLMANYNLHILKNADQS